MHFDYISLQIVIKIGLKKVVVCSWMNENSFYTPGPLTKILRLNFFTMPVNLLKSQRVLHIPLFAWLFLI